MDGTEIKVFLDDKFEGIRIVEISNKTIEIIVCPREQMTYFEQDDIGMKFKHKTGVYLLIGNDIEQNKDYLYVGETDDFISRIKQHLNNKADENKYDIKSNFQTLIFITTLDNSLDKTKILYIESELIKFAKKNKNIILNNSNNGQNINIDLKQKKVLNKFIFDIKIILNLLNISIFNIKNMLVSTNTDDEFINSKYNKTNKLFLISKTNKFSAEAFFSDGNFIVLENSWTSIPDFAPYVSNSIINLFTKMLREKKIEQVGNKFILTSNYVFNSPSQAATIFLKRNSNGWTEWKNSKGIIIDKIYNR